jgi:hypothetical protein
MAYSFNGSSQYISISSAAVTAAPLTIACWFYVSNTVNNGLINVSSASGDQNFRLSAQGATAGDPVRAQALNGAANGFADTTAAFANNTWTHGCGVFTSSTSRTVYINAGNSATNTTSVTPPSIDRMFIGVTRNGSAFTNYTNGYIAEVGIWNTNLTLPEVAALAKGASPIMVRPQNIVFYAPLIRNLIDVRNNRTLTNNSATVVAQTRIYY